MMRNEDDNIKQIKKDLRKRHKNSEPGEKQKLGNNEIAPFICLYH